MEKKICLNCGSKPMEIWDAPSIYGTWGYYCPPCAEELSKHGEISLTVGRLYRNTEKGLKRPSTEERKENILEGVKREMNEEREYHGEPTNLVKTLMERDNLSRAAAEAWVLSAKEELYEMADEELYSLDTAEFMAEFFSLEPDYFIDLI